MNKGKKVKTFEAAHAVFKTMTFKKDALYQILQKRKASDLTSADKLMIICRVLNGDWLPDWTDYSQYKYYPWFTHKSGFGLSYGDCVYARTDASVGARLCYKTSDLAKYAGTQFADLYNDYLTLK